MATLKSIKNYYGPDAEAGVNTNKENIALLAFKLATQNTLSKYNLVDGFVDDYQDTTGVDAPSSTNEVRNSTGKYFYGAAPGNATGGTTSNAGGYTYHSYTNTGAQTFVVPAGSAANIEVVMVAGGGGGGWHHGGGGGGGGLLHDTALAVTAQTYAMDIGLAGTSPGGNDTLGNPGGDTTGFGWTAKGGGGGGHHSNVAGRTGGNGGGGGGYASPGGSSNQISAGTGSSGTRTAYGTAGGNRSSQHAADGHGGGAFGESGPYGRALYLAAFDTAQLGGPNYTGAPVTSSYGYFSGGGGGGSDGGTGFGGGAGAGNGGAASQNGTVATGTWGSGGGGGGGGGKQGRGGAQGYIGIRYVTGSFNVAGGDMTLQSNTFTAAAQPTSTRIMLDEGTKYGSTVLDTDIKAYASRDGTNFDQIPLVDQGEIVPADAGGNDANTLLLINFDGVNDNITFSDTSSNTHSVSNNGVLSKTAEKAPITINTASGFFDGTDDYLTVAASDLFALGDDDFTIDYWINFTAFQAGGINMIFDRTASGNGYQWYSTSTGWRLWANGLTNTYITGAATQNLNTWYHVALVKQGTAYKVFQDGVDISTGNIGSGNFTDAVSGTTLKIGDDIGNANRDMTGYIDEFRVSNNVRWWAAFTPPTRVYDTGDPFPRRMLSGTVDLSSQPAGTNMKYKVTTHNQSASGKETLLYATAMAWS